MRKKRTGQKREPTTALINIVFLMLVFFMVAGTLAPPMDGRVTLVQTRDLDGAPPPDALVAHADGTLSYRGQAVSDGASYLSDLPAENRARVRIVPDRDFPATDLIALARDLQTAGAEQVVVVTERGLR